MHQARRWFTTALLLLAGAAHASVPTPPSTPGSTSTMPSAIYVVGARAGVPDTRGTFRVHVAQFPAPIAGAQVRVDASIDPDLRMELTGSGSTATTNCNGPSLTAITDRNGDVDITVMGASTGNPGRVGSCEVQIIANGVLFGTIPVAILDLDGKGGIGINDLSLLLADLGTGEFIGRDDYDFSGTIGVNDLSVWIEAFGTGNSSESAVLCP